MGYSSSQGGAPECTKHLHGLWQRKPLALQSELFWLCEWRESKCGALDWRTLFFPQRLAYSHHYPHFLWLFSSFPSNITQETDLIKNLLKLSERKPLNQVWWCGPIIQPPGSEDYKFQTSLGYKVSLRSTWSAQQDPISKQTRAAKPLNCPLWLCCSPQVQQPLPPWSGKSSVAVIQHKPTFPGYRTFF